MVNASSVAEAVSGYGRSVFSGVLAKLLLALLILLGGFILGRLLGRLTEFLLREVEVDRWLERWGFKMPLERTIATILSYAVYVLAIVFTLETVGITNAVLYVVIGGAITLIVFTTILGVRDIVSNFLAGLLIYRKGLFREGQRITVQNVDGVVKRISIVETELVTKKGDRVHIPNALLLRSTLVVRKG